jgi:MFS family permease
LLALAATAHAVAALGFGGVPVGLGGGLHLGEISHPPLREVVAHVGRLLGARPCGLAMTLTGGHRALLGATFATVVIVADTRFDLGASGYAATVALLSTGALIGTLTAPVVARRWQRGRVSVVALVTAGVAGVLMALALDHPAVVAAAVVAMAFAFQNLRVVADATVQSEVDDDALGRVFAVYDAVYNLAFVAGALVAIGLVGRVTAAQMLLAVGVTYVVASVMHSLDSKRCPW